MAIEELRRMASQGIHRAERVRESGFSTLASKAAETSSAFKNVQLLTLPGKLSYHRATSPVLLYRQHGLKQPDLRQPRRNARHVHMVVGDWRTETRNSRSSLEGLVCLMAARQFLCWVALCWLGCAPAQIGLLRPRKADFATGRAVVTWSANAVRHRFWYKLITPTARADKIKLTANSCIALCNSTNPVKISSARTIKRFP